MAEEEESDDAAEVTWGIVSHLSIPKRLTPPTEDQQRISTFSKLNTRLRGIEDRLEALTVSTHPLNPRTPFSPIIMHRRHRQQEKEALDDLATELELTDEDQIIPYVSPSPSSIPIARPIPSHSPHRYKIGESFLHLPLPRALKRLEKDQADITAQLTDLSATAEECEKGMKALKVVLYAKFGRAINLDE